MIGLLIINFMQNLLFIILSLLNFRRINYQTMNPVVADIVAALSLIALITAITGFISTFFQFLGWVNAKTIEEIAVYLALHTPMIASTLVVLILLFHDSQLIDTLINYSKLAIQQLKTKLSQKKTENDSIDMNVGISGKKMM